MLRVGEFVMQILKATIVFAALAFASTGAQSASVIAVSTTDLAAQSDFIFQGKAIRSWVAAGPAKGSILTYLEFAVSDVIKGDRNRKSVVLSFLGGNLNGRVLRVDGLMLPSVGEEGVYFVERLGRNQVHPLYGWDQGRFLVQSDAQGGKSVFTHDMKPVGGFDRASAAARVNTGHAVGVAEAGDEHHAMSVDAFKSRVRALVGEQQ
jgi:hypothetical protein